MTADTLADLSMSELFRIEAASQTQALIAGLLELERSPRAPDQLEACMRAAHSLKGAARIVGLDSSVALAHAMEECFVAAQEDRVVLGRGRIDVLLRGVDLLIAITRTPDLAVADAATSRKAAVDLLLADLGRVLTEPAPPETAEPAATAAPSVASGIAGPHSGDRALRVSVDNLDRLLGLAGESLVEARRLKPFADSLLRLKRMQREAGMALERLSALLPAALSQGSVGGAAIAARQRLLDCQELLALRLDEVDLSDQRSTNLSHRLYNQASACRMQPFADGTAAFPRMVRDLGRALGKKVRLDLTGAATPVDRDILERLDAPLGHLLRNAVDHGIETPAERQAAGKPDEGVITLDARHSGGALVVVVSDDGAGVDLDRLRRKLEGGALATVETIARLSEAELLEFLFLPAFTMKGEVTEVSGRGVGLDVVRDMIRQVGGVVSVASEFGRGARFQLQLPLTLSVVRALLVEVGGEAYAFPFAHILRAVTVRRDEIETLEGRQHFRCEGRQVGLVAAGQLFGGEAAVTGDALCVVLVGDPSNPYGLVVDRFLGGRELVVQRLDPRLGKIMDISAGALMEDGTPVLIADVEDMIVSMKKLSVAQRLVKVGGEAAAALGARRKRVLVVDDSLTVREIERKLLGRHGYDTEVAVDGMDGWNAVRAGGFDLVVTDIDMPRMDGIELVTQIKRNPNLKGLPVMIVSYKDREEDRRRGLEAGADYYLTKASFNDEALLRAVVDLIGEAAA